DRRFQTLSLGHALPPADRSDMINDMIRFSDLSRNVLKIYAPTRPAAMDGAGGNEAYSIKGGQLRCFIW
ncbi:MAG: hypothetical protein N3A02_02120, partial [Rectinema sp.]|nr:hypothetical protein [Rectinema sp.]